MGNVRYCGRAAVQETQEDGAGVGTIAVDLLRRLLGQTAHHTLDTAEEKNKDGERESRQ